MSDNKIPPVTLGWRLRMALEHAGLKRSDMAEVMDVNIATITRWTHDLGSPPRRIYLEKWAELCGVSVDWLAGDADLKRVRAGVSSRRLSKVSTRDCSATTRRRGAHRAVSCLPTAA
jgi:transcriptional regulator with XRE-family HTH domain